MGRRPAFRVYLPDASAEAKSDAGRGRSGVEGLRTGTSILQAAREFCRQDVHHLAVAYSLHLCGDQKEIPRGARFALASFFGSVSMLPLA